MGSADHSGNCAASSLRTRSTPVSTSSTCILRSAKRSALLHAQQVFLAVQRVVVRAWPGRDRPADSFVAVERTFQDAFATRQSGQLSPQLVYPSSGNVALQRARGTPNRRRL